ncbi:hypothetical protein SLEP1_g45079 [Rubroshorea leprosula]|uniref:Uncharacterized protein n=1 Tax=Rubroshorea leprosula TaxID=152421 RepID=A0AAV5LIP3_9ROSI|nr:hypothetical protein SLEP1_g45079 [Rubroshorea leprosula]
MGNELLDFKNGFEFVVAGRKLVKFEISFLFLSEPKPKHLVFSDPSPLGKCVEWA